MKLMNWFKGAKAKAFVILGSFAMLLGVGASVYSVTAAQQNEVVETKAATTQTWTGDTGSLFFVPNNTWKSNYYDDGGYRFYMYPCIYIQWGNGAYQNAAWPGVAYSYSNNNVFRFDNIPLTSLNQITVSWAYDFSNWRDTSPRADFSSTSRSAWWNGSSQSKNVFGLPNDGWYRSGGTEYTMTSGTYYQSPVETIVSGSIYHENLNWPNWPSSKIGLAGTSSEASVTMDFVYGDEFRLVFINELNNVSTGASDWRLWGQTSSSDTNGGRDWKSYDNLTFTIYDDCISTSSAVSDKSKYIVKSGNNIKVVHAGRVTITSTSKRGTSITLRWSATSSRTFSPSSSLPGTVPGTFNGWDTAANSITWNPRTGRYETLAPVFSGDRFKFFGTNWCSISTLTDDIASGSTRTGGGGSDWTITSATGYYAIGWYYQNTNPSGAPAGTPKYFLDYSNSFFTPIKSTVATAEALCKRISLYTTCDASNATATGLNALYTACGYASKQSYMSSYDITDYSYQEWEDNGESYEGLTKKYGTNAWDKYEWILYIGGVTNTRPSSAISVGPSNDQSPLTLTLWIVLGAGILGMGAIGTAYFVSKKKKRHQA